jgi:PRC-barrel domain
MSKQALAAIALVLAFSGGLDAQPQPPAAPPAAPSMLPAPPTPEPTRRSTLKPDENTAKSVLGARIFTAKTGGANAAPWRPASPPGVRVAQLAQNDWDALRRSHDDIGDVADIVLTETGEARAVVLDVGGHLGLDEKAVAVDWADIGWMQDPSGNLFGVIHRTRDELESAPRFARAN